MRKILYTTFFLLILLNTKCFALTPQYLCTSGGTWSGSIWVLTTGAQAACTGGAVYTNTDTATLNASSGSVTLAANQTAAGLDMTGYTGTLTVNSGDTLTISAGDPLVLNGNFAGTGTISSNSGGVTLKSTPGGSTFPLILLVANQNWTSGGFNWPGTVCAENNTITQVSNGFKANTFENFCSAGTFHPIIAGAFDQTFANLGLYFNTAAAETITFPASQTTNVTNSLQLWGHNPQGMALTIEPPSTTSFNLNYTGTAANADVENVNFSYVTSTGLALSNYYGGTLTSTSGITNVNASNIGGSRGYIYGG